LYESAVLRLRGAGAPQAGKNARTGVKKMKERALRKTGEIRMLYCSFCDFDSFFRMVHRLSMSLDRRDSLR
jgi:hypothetical protein